MTSHVSGKPATCFVEQCTHTPEKQPAWRKATYLTSIYNDTNNTINVDFKFTYHDKYYNIASNIGNLNQITDRHGGIDINSKKWCEIYIEEDHEFHLSKGASIRNLFQLKVDDEIIYNNYKYKENEKSTSMIQNYEILDHNKVISFPCALKISK